MLIASVGVIVVLAIIALVLGLPDRTTQYVETCTYEREEEQPQNEDESDKEKNEEKEDNEDNVEREENEEKEENVDNVDAGESKTTSEYADLSRFYGYTFPLLFCVSYEEGQNGNISVSAEDKGDYYLLEGNLMCLECYVDNSGLNGNWEEDRYITRSGRIFTQESIETYGEALRQKMVVLGDDGNRYEIWGIPSHTFVNGTMCWQMVAEDGRTKPVTVYENIKIRIDKDTHFTQEGFTDQTFGEWIQDAISIDWDGYYEGPGLHINFAEDGTINRLEFDDYGKDGFDGYYEIWQGKLE